MCADPLNPLASLPDDSLAGYQMPTGLAGWPRSQRRRSVGGPLAPCPGGVLLTAPPLSHSAVGRMELD